VNEVNEGYDQVEIAKALELHMPNYSGGSMFVFQRRRRECDCVFGAR
jgi:hypothetical protein